MKTGWIGLGKLGLPVALTSAKYGGHEICGYDTDPRVREVLAGTAAPPCREEGMHLLLPRGQVLMPSVQAVVSASEIVFVCVQTPHAPGYGGEAPMPAVRRDFEYQFLAQAVRDVCRAAGELRKPITLVIVSTVLPGTTHRLLSPLAGPGVRLLYSPAFIAMGTVVEDWRHPEFVICGADDPAWAGPLQEFHAALHDAPVIVTSVETAELVKIAYNVYISSKIVFANSLMEIAHKTGADCDVVSQALTLATDRVISPEYLRGGMGDGGACHPRDLIALSWLAERLDLSYDLAGTLIEAREAQTAWLADLATSYADQCGLPLVLFGKAYKPGSELTAGSPALLLASLLESQGVSFEHYDPVMTGWPFYPPVAPAVFVITTQHVEFAGVKYPAGSVVLDPWGYIGDQPGVTVVRIGRKS